MGLDQEEFDLVPVVPQDRMEALQELLGDAIALSDSCETLEGDLKAAKAELHRLCSRVIPEEMKGLGISEMTARGRNVSIKDFVSGSLPKSEDKRKAAFKWLEDNEAGDLIKTTVAVSFGRSEHNYALSLAGELREKGLEVQAESSVHASTLKSFARERLRCGDPLDTEVLGLFVGEVARISEVSS